MSETSDPWDEPPTAAKATSCCVCGKPTTSHAICVVDDDNGKYGPATGLGDADYSFPVCHTCYTEYDGNGRAVIDQLNTTLAPKAAETLGITSTQFQAVMEDADLSAEDVGDVYMGEATVEKFAERELESGTILRINEEDEKMVTVPAREEKLDKVAGDIIFPLVEVGVNKSSGKGGGLMRSENPRDSRIFYGYAAPDDAGVEFVPVERLEVLGHTDKVDEMDGV